jgi:hypothetical protein
VAVVVAIAWALYRHDCDATSLARCPGDLSDLILATREGFRALVAPSGVPMPFADVLYGAARVT